MRLNHLPPTTTGDTLRTKTLMTNTGQGVVTARARDITAAIEPVLQTLDSPHSRIAYRRALVEFVDWWVMGGESKSGAGVVDRAAVMAWRREMVDSGKWAAATVNQRLAAVKAMVRELAHRGVVTWEVVGQVESVKGVKAGGVRTGNWLSRTEVEKLLAAPDMGTLMGLRDAAILRLILSGGLRRDDAARLRGSDLQLIAGRWALVDITGKGGRVGTIPIAAWAAEAVHAWQAARAAAYPERFGNDRHGVLAIFTRVPQGHPIKGGAWNLSHTDPLTDKSIANVVKKYGAVIGRPELAAHDLRRTFAKHAEEGGASIHQVQQSLRHASLETTTRYLGSGQDMHRAPCDYLEFDMPEVPKNAQ